MRTIEYLVKAKKFFIETFTDGKFPTREQMLEKLIPSRFVPVNTKILFSLYYTTEILQDKHQKMVEPYGVTASQVEILKILYFSKDSSITQEELGKCTFSSKANISTHLYKLESKGLIKRQEDSNNKRKKLVTLTKPGENLLFTLINDLNPDFIKSFLTKEETKNFLNYLAKIREKMAEVPITTNKK